MFIVYFCICLVLMIASLFYMKRAVAWLVKDWDDTIINDFNFAKNTSYHSCE